MKNFDLWKLVFKKVLCLSWICAVFTLLFSTVMFVGFAREDMLRDLYKDIVDDIKAENVTMQCDYKSGTSYGDSQICVYYSKSKETYDVYFVHGENSVLIDSYNRGLNVCVINPEVNRYVEGGGIKVGDDDIWLYKDYANYAGINVGDTIRISGDTDKTYRVAGLYTGNISEWFKVGYIPFFIVAQDTSHESASLVVGAQDVYALYLSDMQKCITNDGGVFVLCEGYYLTQVSFTLLFILFAAVAVFILAKTINYFLKHFARQTFLLSVFGLSKFKQSAIYISVLTVYGLASLIAGIGVFYVFVAIADSLASSIMGLKFTNVSAVSVALFTFIGFVLTTVAVTLRTILKTTLEKGVA